MTAFASFARWVLRREAEFRIQEPEFRMESFFDRIFRNY